MGKVGSEKEKVRRKNGAASGERQRTRRDPGNGAFGGSDIEGKAAMGSGE
jgi:hypothetical protein